jgi:hypothetical protein
VLNAAESPAPCLQNKKEIKNIYSLIGDDGLLDFLNNPSLLKK